jgi:hypothetical protein
MHFFLSLAIYLSLLTFENYILIPYKGKGKGKVAVLTEHHARKAYSRSGGITPLIL